MTRDTLKLKDLKAKLWKRYKQSRTHYDNQRYRRVKNELRTITRRLRETFESNIAIEVKNQPKKFWADVNSRTKTRSKIPPLKNDDGSKAITAAEKAEALNRFFSSVFTEERLDNIPEDHADFSGELLDMFAISPEMVLKKLNELNPNKTPGPDGWHPYLLKQLETIHSVPTTLERRNTLNTKNFGHLYFGHLNFGQKLSAISPELVMLSYF